MVAVAATVGIATLLLATLLVGYRHLNSANRDPAPPGFVKAHNHDVVLQRGYADCGPAAIATLDRLIGRRDRLEDLVRRLKTSEAGTTVDRMRDELSVQTRQPVDLVRETVAQVPRTGLPVIVWHNYHYMVLVDNECGHVEVLDPWFGDIVSSADEVRGWMLLVLSPRRVSQLKGPSAPSCRS